MMMSSELALVAPCRRIAPDEGARSAKGVLRNLLVAAIVWLTSLTALHAQTAVPPPGQVIVVLGGPKATTASVVCMTLASAVVVSAGTSTAAAA